MHDGLVALNPKTLSVVPAIAKKWEVNDAQTTYTFQLHDNAYFHDDPCFSDGKGKKITSNDFLYTFNLLCGNLSSTGYNALNEKILGAADFHSGKTETISGIKIVNDSVFSIELIEPASSFVHLLASPLGSVISKDAFEAYGKELKVGAGPFIYGELNNDSSNLKLYKNNNYYQKDQFGNNLPYLDEISFTFESNEERREELFSTRKLDLLQGVSEIYLEKFFVENQKTFMSREFMVDRKDVLATDCYEFNNINEPFNDVRVRKAFNYAINKKKLIENILDNQGKIGLKGVVPNIKLFKNYNFEEIIINKFKTHVFHFCKLDYLTRGPVETALIGINNFNISSKQSCIFIDNDNVHSQYPKDNYEHSFIGYNIDFTRTNYSFIKFTDDKVIEIKEKETHTETSVLKNAPHTLQMATADKWSFEYSRQKALYPLNFVQENKFWPSVRRVDEAFGDRNLVCSCLPIEEYSNN